MKELYKALAAFQSEVPTIKKNAAGYSYNFADLEEINNVIKPLLTKHGLGYIQPIEGSSIKTIIFHVESGESIESLTDIPQGVQLAKMNDFQVLGSAITYLRRYSLSSMLGLVTDEDADAAGEQVKTAPAAPKVDLLPKAKKAINAKLEELGCDNAVSKKAKVYAILNKSTIDSLDDANYVMDELESEEKELNIETRDMDYSPSDSDDGSK